MSGLMVGQDVTLGSAEKSIFTCFFVLNDKWINWGTKQQNKTAYQIDIWCFGCFICQNQCLKIKKLKYHCVLTEVMLQQWSGFPAGWFRWLEHPKQSSNLRFNLSP